MEPVEDDTDKPKVQLVGQDGNAFMIIGLCVRAMKRSKWDTAKREEMLARLMAAGSYDNLLRIVISNFEVE